ncbi:integrating conjugative element protein [Porticoccus sp. GXU_MW_L64]
MRWLLLCLCLGAPPVLWAKALIVIHDSGNTSSVEQYLPKPIKQAEKRKPALPFTLPITTPSMTPGKVATTAKSFPHLQQPLFLIGTDPTSRTWLKARRESLIQAGAVGLIVEATSLEDIQRITKIAPELRMVPASAESIANQLGIRHYPILISRQGWEQ